MGYTIENATIYGLCVSLGVVLISHFAYRRHKEAINKTAGIDIEPHFKWVYTGYMVFALLIIIFFGIKSTGGAPDMGSLEQTPPSEKRMIEIIKIKEENDTITVERSPALDIRDSVDSYDELVKRLTNNQKGENK